MNRVGDSRKTILACNKIKAKWIICEKRYLPKKLGCVSSDVRFMNKIFLNNIFRHPPSIFSKSVNEYTR